MAYYVKGARGLGADGEVGPPAPQDAGASSGSGAGGGSSDQWSRLGTQVANTLVTPENIRAGTQAASGILQTLLQRLPGMPQPQPAAPPPATARSSGMSGGAMIALAVVGLTVVGGGVYLLTKKSGDK